MRGSLPATSGRSERPPLQECFKLTFSPVKALNAALYAEAYGKPAAYPRGNDVILADGPRSVCTFPHLAAHFFIEYNIPSLAYIPLSPQHAPLHVVQINGDFSIRCSHGRHCIGLHDPPSIPRTSIDRRDHPRGRRWGGRHKPWELDKAQHDRYKHGNRYIDRPFRGGPGTICHGRQVSGCFERLRGFGGRYLLGVSELKPVDTCTANVVALGSCTTTKSCLTFTCTCLPPPLLYLPEI